MNSGVISLDSPWPPLHIYPRWLKVPGPLDIGPFLTQFPILFAYIDIYGFWGARYKREYNFSYLDCYSQFPILFTYIDIYGFWGPLIK